MNNNPFIQNKKFNPDILNIFDKKEKERNHSAFKYTNDIEEKYKIIKEEIKQDKPLRNLQQLINDREKERKSQEEEFDFKQKKNILDVEKEFNDFNNLKNNQKKTIKKNCNVDNILDDLKNLGILN